MSGHNLSDSSVKAVMMYIVTYVLLIFVSILVVMMCGADATDAVSGVIASIGSVGPGLGDLGSLDNYSAQASVAKFVYTLDMFMGRVEIYPILVVISMIFRSSIPVMRLLQEQWMTLLILYGRFVTDCLYSRAKWVIAGYTEVQQIPTSLPAFVP
jgi:hypothetical protein